MFTIVSPVVMEIDGDSYKDAIKNFVKLNYALNLQRVIIQDRYNNYREANIKYYKENDKKKVGIDIYPVPGIYM